MANQGSNSLLGTAAQSTWLERLLINIFSYSIVTLPIAFIVIATRVKLFPQTIQSNVLIQYFVYGSSENKHDNKDDNNDDNNDDNKLLLDDKPKQKSSNEFSTTGFLEFIWCLLGLQVSYLIWGFLQEKIMTTSYTTINQDLTVQPPSNSSELLKIQSVTFHDSQFLVLINRVVAFITAILALVYSHRSTLHLARASGNKYQARASGNKPPAPIYKFIYCSMSNILSSWCQYEALKYVNFPTQCLSKSCKVIPTMIMSNILLRKRHSSLDYFCAFLLATGMFVFMLNQDTGEKIIKDNSAKISGLIILGLYLTFDSFTSNWQQSLYSQYDISNWQMMAAVNFYSILLTLTSLNQLGSLRPAFKLLASSPELMRDCLVMSLTSSIGQIFVYHTIKRFGSVSFSVMMTLRQFLSILLSYIIYKHHITFGSSLGLVLVLLVVAFQTWLKTNRTSNKTVAVQNESTARNLFKHTGGDTK